MLKLSTMFKVLAVSALVMGFGLMVIGSDNPAPIQPLPEGDGANWDLKEQLAPVHEDPQEDVEPDQQMIDQKEAERLLLSKAHEYSLDLRSTPVESEGVQYMHPMTELFFEGFNSTVPPTGWTTVVNNAYTWELGTYAPYEGTGYATCYYDETYSGPQDEWLISPTINLTTGGPWYLDFWWQMSYYWGVDPYDNYDLKVMVSTDDGLNWTQVWTEGTDVFTSWTWYNVQLSLSGFTSATFKLALVYQGYDGAQGSFDAVSINDAAPPVGRCCSGVDFLTCDDLTEADCAALGGHWNGYLDCTTPCPSVPANDDWTTAEEIYPPCTVTGSTENATLDCPGVLDWNAVWYVFEAPYAENDVDVDFCGTVPGLTTVGVVLYADPVNCPDYILRTNYEWWACGDGEDNPHIWWDRLPGPATYYFPVFTGNTKAQQPFSYDITVDESPPLPPGGSCGDPYPLSLGSGDLPHTESGLVTCGMGNVYTETCLGYYDGGEDFIMELTLTDEVNLKVTLDPLGTTYTGMSIDNECPDANSTCIATSTAYSGTHTMVCGTLAAGTYYIMVDTWPAPDCIPAFTLTFDQIIVTGGDNCGDPFVVKLPDDMVEGPGSDQFIDINYTCARLNDYSTTCLGSYDGGEDIIYMLDVSGPLDDLMFKLSSSSTWKGMLIDDACPPDPTTCLYKATASSGDVIITNVDLATGYYYIMIDTWPSPACIPEFTLTISPPVVIEGDNWAECEELSGDVVNLPYTTIGYTPDGPQGCMYGPNRWYCYTPTITGVGTVSLCGSSYDTKVAVYDGVDPYSSTMMGCNDDYCGLQSQLDDLVMVLGNTYLIEVGGYSSASGAGILNVTVVECEAPPNQYCEDVTPVTLIHGAVETFTGDNTCAVNQCASFPGGHVWHAITLPTTMDVTLDYCTNSPAWGNAWLNLAIGCPCTGFTFAASYEFSSCGDGNVTMVWDDLPAGTYYYPVMKDPYYGSVGPYTLHVVGYAPSLLTADPEAIDFGTQPAGSMGSLPLTLGAVGPGDINFAISYVYYVKSYNAVPYTDLGTTWSEKPTYGGPPNVPSEQKQGGDNVGTATVISTIPHYSTGTTAGYINDYDAVCPYAGSTSPDVVYSYAPGADIHLTLDLCASGYDTKVYVYENSVGNMIACNDDACPGYRSYIEDVPMTGGNTYYIVVDGYGGDYGDYVLDISEYVVPDPFECPPGAGSEVEACGEDLNGGCNMAVPGFQPIACGDTVCGTIWADGGTRDTDWYTVDFYVQTDVTFTGSANFPFVIGFVDTSDCNLASSLNPYAVGNPDDVKSVTRTCGPGTYWVFMSHQSFYDYPCGTSNDYWIALDCPEGPVLWLSAAPEGGTIPSNGTLPISVNWDATELTNGLYEAALKILHDGRGEKIVPCMIEIGDVVPPDTLVLDPEIINWMMVNEVEDVDGHIYIGDDLGWVNPVVTAVGNGTSTIPCTQETIGYYPGLTAPILKLTFDLGDFAGMYDEGLMWDCDTRSYVVTGADDGGPISAGDDFTYCGHTAGDLNLDGVIDISDLVFMVEWMFNGGDAPQVLETADLDGNGAVDISDLVYMVDYMFMGGAAPQHP